MIKEARFALDSPLEGRVRSEPVSKLGRFRAILDGNKLVFGAENREEIATSARDRLAGDRF